jgi:hypothetical protein
MPLGFLEASVGFLNLRVPSDHTGQLENKELLMVWLKMQLLSKRISKRPWFSIRAKEVR